jgi:two-component system OmpR family response regulator
MTTVNADIGGKLRSADDGPVRVLVIDDESTLAELRSMALRYEGWEVLSAGDAGREPMIHTMRGVGYVLKPAD